MAISTPMLVTFIIYILGMVLIGFIAWRSTKNFDDYILGGRSLGPFVTALSAGASDMSGWLLMGLPGAIFLSGISESWIAIGLTLGAWVNWKLVAGRLRVHIHHHYIFSGILFPILHIQSPFSLLYQKNPAAGEVL